MGSFFSTIIELMKIFTVIIVFSIVWLILAIIGAVAVNSADDFRKSITPGTRARAQADAGWEKLKNIEILTWSGFVIAILLAIVMMILFIFFQKSKESDEDTESFDLDDLFTAEGITTLVGNAKDELLKSKSKYDENVKSKYLDLTSLQKSCKKGLLWSRYFANFSGFFTSIRSLINWAAGIGLFIIGIIFAQAATELGDAQNLVEADLSILLSPSQENTIKISSGKNAAGWGAFLGITPFVIVIVWGILHFIYKYAWKCPAEKKEIKELVEIEKNLDPNKKSRKNKSNTQDSNTKNTKNKNTKNKNTKTPNTQTPNTQNPNTQDSNTQTPNTQDSIENAANKSFSINLPPKVSPNN